MDARLQEMLDHYEITRTLKQYCFASDRCDQPRMASVYLEDSWDDHGIYAAPGPEFSRIMTQAILEQTDTLFHLLGQTQINVEGDEAGAETYYFAASRSTSGDGVAICNQLGGRFVDRLERKDGSWLIKKRIVTRDWAISMPIQSDWTEHVGMTAGQRSNADPAFAILGRRHSDADRPIPNAVQERRKR